MTHTDHPIRHWDRSCPACQEDVKHARNEIEEILNAKHKKKAKLNQSLTEQQKSVDSPPPLT